MGIRGTRMLPARRPGRRDRGFRALFGAICLCASAHLAGCGRDFQHPFLPQSDSYPGSAWSEDADRNGVSDSVDKYAPGCAEGPSVCLRKAQANAGRQSRPVPRIPVTGIRAQDLVLAPGESRLPGIAVEPADATDPGYELRAQDPAVAFIREGMVVGAAAGRTRITVRTLDGGHEARFTARVRPVGPGTTRNTATAEGGLKAGFPVTVEAAVAPVRSIKVKEMNITLLAANDDPSVARVVGGSVEVLKQGEAKVTVTVLIPCGVLYSCEEDDD